MYRNVEINVPMFIGIILLVAVVTGVLVFGIRILTQMRNEHNLRINEELQEIDNIINTEAETNEIIENNLEKNENTE